MASPGSARDQEWAALLATVDLFRGLDRIALARLAANLDPVAFEGGEAACVRGEPGDSLYIVSQGALGVYIAGADTGEEVRVATLRPPAAFGEMALLTGEPRSATVRAAGPAEALRLERSRFVDLLRREPTIGLAISATLSGRLVQADQRYLRLERLAEAALDERLAPLVGAGQWDEALALVARDRAMVLATLEGAVGDEAWLRGSTAGEWLAGLGDEEMAAHPALASARRKRQERAFTLAVSQRETEQAHDSGGAAERAPAGGHRLDAAVSARPGGPAPLTVRQAVAAVGALGLAGAAFAAGSDRPQVTFLCLLGAAIVLWVTAVLPDFAVGIALATGWIVTGLATPGEALAGYGTPIWTTAFTIFGLAAAISTSGLLFRLGLLLLRRMPNGLIGQSGSFLLTGLILTAMLPSSTSRGALAVPLALTAAQSQRLEERSPESALLGLSAYIGANPVLYAFLSGSTSCLLALGLLPEASRARFDWTTWFVAALPVAATTLLGSLGLLVLIFRPKGIPAGSRSRLSLQLSLLGPPSRREIAMAAVLLLTVVGWNFASGVGLSSVAVGLLALMAAIVAGCFTRQSLQTVNWDFLVSYGVVIGLAQLAGRTGVDRLLADAIAAALGGRTIAPLPFVLGVAVACLVVRVFIPQDQTLLLLGLALIPLAPLAGVDPWIVTISILAVFSPWFYTAQTMGYPVAYEASEGRLFSHGQARLASLAYVLASLAGLALAVPYWRLLGLV